VDADWTRELAGLWMDVQVALMGDSAICQGTKGPLLFTRAGLTVQAAFDISRLVGPALAEGRRQELLVNFFPEQSRDEVEQWLFRTLGGQTRVRAVEALEPILPPPLAAAFLARQKIKPGARVDRLEQTHRKGLMDDMLGLRLAITGTLGFEAAEDFTGGVNVREIDPRTFASRVAPGLYVIGRMLDIDADWGGFRQHFALASGMLAGGHAGRSLDAARPQG
jgi:predicted Rossmann fold flavoprotein